METLQKVRENRLRRMAERRGLILTKSRRRDTLASDYGTWTLRTAQGEVITTESGDDALDRIEQALLDPALMDGR